VGKLEAKLAPPPKPEKQHSNAPPPITPVRAGSTPKVETLEDASDYTAFERLRMAGKG
jgi:hypothetical protein